jgi:RNA polymerase sigma-70 factor (ECF subfamily)
MTVDPASGEMRKVPSDAELLGQSSRGNQTAFRELINRHGRYLYGIAQGCSGNAADADDLVQETLIGALNAKFRGESSVRTFLVSILIRQAGMLRRKKKRQAGWMSLNVEGGQEGGAVSSARSGEANSGSDARLDLSVMLQALSPEHRQVIILRELEQMTYEEIAVTLGVPRGTVESRLHRAREELRRRFKGYEP